MENRTSLKNIINVPDWYRIERDASNTISKLNTIRDLEFYLGNSDAYVRQQAILRVSSSVLKDAVQSLNRVLEDPIEHSGNKELAAWTLKKILAVHDVPWFIRSPLCDAYTGEEALERFRNITVIEDAKSLNLRFSDSLAKDSMLQDSQWLRSQIDEKEIILDFSWTRWLKKYSKDILRYSIRYCKQGAISTCRFIFRTLVLSFLNRLKKSLFFIGRLVMEGFQKTKLVTAKKVIIFQNQISEKKQNRKLRKPDVEKPEFAEKPSSILDNHPPAPLPASMIEKSNHKNEKTPTDGEPAVIWTPAACMAAQNAGIHTIQRNPSPSFNHVVYDGPSMSVHNLRSSHKYRQSWVANSNKLILGRGVKSMFKLIFYPVRLVKQHWVFTSAVVLSFYLLLTFTSFGRVFLHNVNPTIESMNDHFLISAKIKAYEWLNIRSAGKSDSNALSDDQTQSGINTNLLTQETKQGVDVNLNKDGLNAGGSEKISLTVTAPKGLNLRTSPDGEKVVFMPMKTVVTFEGQIKKDDKGNLWYQVVSPDGRTGWASAQYLKGD
jgi:hypothetical protein